MKSFSFSGTRRFGLVVLSALAAFTSAGLHAQPLIWEAGHMDLRINYTADGWSAALHHDDFGSAAPGSIYLHGRDQAFPDGSRIIRPVGETWDFIGVAAGDPFWLFPQVQEMAVLWPGFSTEQTDASLLAQHAINDPRIPFVEARWMPIQLVDVRYSGEAEEAHFSMWTAGTFGGADVWMSTVDGITENDVWFQLAQGHSHMNWGFSEPGIYEVDLRASTVLAGSLDQIHSDVYTVTFAVGVIPEPAHVGLGLGAAVLLILPLYRRIRYLRSNT